jgi:hypothetical protein
MKNKFLFISATHGDEGFSIETLKELEKQYDKEKFGYSWIIGNEKACSQSTRFIDQDLNRAAPGNRNSKAYEERRAAEIVRLSKDFDFIIDIHGSDSNSGITTLIPYPTLQNIILATMFDIKRNIIWYAKSAAKKGCLAQFVHCPAIEVECGPKNSRKTMTDLYIVLAKFIKRVYDFDINQHLEETKEKEFYFVYGKEKAGSVKKRKDFVEVKKEDETFFPYLSGQYPDITCYKTKIANFPEFFLY